MGFVPMVITVTMAMTMAVAMTVAVMAMVATTVTVACLNRTIQLLVLRLPRNVIMAMVLSMRHC